MSKRNNSSWEKEWAETTSKIKKSGRKLDIPIGYDTSGLTKSKHKDPTAKEAIRRCGR